MVESRKYKVRIPLEIRKDRYTDAIIGVVPTTLGETEVVNLRNEISVLVEKKKLSGYSRHPITEGYNIYVQNGKVFQDFETVAVN